VVQWLRLLAYIQERRFESARDYLAKYAIALSKSDVTLLLL
jgi:hypothetical protein